MNRAHLARVLLAGMIAFTAQGAYCVEQRADVPQPGQVLEKLAAFDQALLSALTVRGLVESSGSSKQGRALRFTTDGSRTAIEELRPAPPYTPAAQQPPRLEGNGRGRPGVSVDAQFSYDAEGNLRMMSSEDKALHIFNKEQSALIQTTVEYLIAPDGTVRERFDKYNRIDRYPPDSIALVLPKVRILSCLGRGFSTSIEKVTNVDSVGEGMLRVTADGVSMMQGPGTWTLLIDPELSYLVREASFVEAGDNKPRFVIDNEGLNDNGKLPIPVQGTFSVTLGDQPVVYQVTFEQVDFKFDPAFYATIEAVVTGKPPANSNVHDRRANPPTYQRIDVNGKRVGGR